MGKGQSEISFRMGRTSEVDGRPEVGVEDEDDDARDNDDAERYYDVAPRDRALVALTYVALAGFSPWAWASPT